MGKRGPCTQNVWFLWPSRQSLGKSMLHSFNRLWKIQDGNWEMEVQILLLAAVQSLKLKQKRHSLVLAIPDTAASAADSPRKDLSQSKVLSLLSLKPVLTEFRLVEFKATFSLVRSKGQCQQDFNYVMRLSSAGPPRPSNSIIVWATWGFWAGCSWLPSTQSDWNLDSRSNVTDAHEMGRPAPQRDSLTTLSFWLSFPSSAVWHLQLYLREDTWDWRSSYLR